jgi:hypothetical protein
MGSIHMPDGGDWSVQMPSLLAAIGAARRSSSSPVTVIFHCMESIRSLRKSLCVLTADGNHRVRGKWGSQCKLCN